MDILIEEDKVRIISEIKELVAQHGIAPLSNISLNGLTSNQFDVVAAGSLVYRQNGTVVLVRRAETPLEWVIPGGIVDPGEKIAETVIREVREETGLNSEIEGILRIGLAVNYGPEAFRKVNKERFGKESINLLFVNFRNRETDGVMDCGTDPSNNILEVKEFSEVPFELITHVYKVLFVQQGLYSANLSNYPAVEFYPES